VKPYPSARIFIAFSLCPALVGGLFAAGLSIRESVEINTIKDFFTVLGKAVGFGTMLMALAEIFFGIPAMLAAFVYVKLKLYRQWHHFLLIIATGALAAHLWSLMYGGHLDYFFAALGAASSFVTALFVLPRKPAETNCGIPE